MNVVGAVHLGVNINHRGSSSETAVSSNLGGTDPMVGTTSCGGLGEAGNVGFNGLVGGGHLPGDLRNLGDGLLDVLETLDNGIGIGLALEVRRLGDLHA